VLKIGSFAVEFLIERLKDKKIDSGKGFMFAEDSMQRRLER
jgi:hypothetical protein